MNKEKNITKVQDARPKVLIIGAVAGAVIGLGAAYLYLQRAEIDNRPPEFTTSDGVKVGLMVLGLLKSIADIGSGNK